MTILETIRGRARRFGPWLMLAASALIALWMGTCLAAPAGFGDTHADHGGGEDAIWTCAMHPQIRQPEPGQCPICGMDLVLVSEGGEGAGHTAHRALGAAAQVLARIPTTAVRALGDGVEGLRLLGSVDYDETRLHVVTPWVGGRVDRLHVRTTGEQVRRGQTIASLYSPEVYTAQQDLIQAHRQFSRLSEGSPTARTIAESALESARSRLRLLGVPAGSLAQMEESERPTRNIAIASPFAGTVVERLVTQGAYVETGTPLYRIADLSRLWVQLDAYESDVARLAVGQPVAFEVDSLPGQRFEGQIDFIDPVVDPRRRRARVRVEVDNADGLLRPGMFVEATTATATPRSEGRVLVIPVTAPIVTGRRTLVYVESPDAERPTYEPRIVRLGSRLGDVFPVLDGLREGERIVTQGTFALDADLQIPSVRANLPVDDVPIEVPADFQAGLAEVLRAYLGLQERLTEDDFEGSKSAGAQLLAAVTDFSPTRPAEAVSAWELLSRQLITYAERFEAAPTLPNVRTAFEAVSRTMVRVLKTFGNPLAEPVSVAFCPMALGGQGADWVQRGETVANAYFGAEMRSCGEVRETVEPGAHLAGGEVASVPEPDSSDRDRPRSTRPRGAQPVEDHSMHAGPGGHAGHTGNTAATKRTSRPGMASPTQMTAGSARAGDEGHAGHDATMAAPSPTSGGGMQAAEVWTCRMHPQIREAQPGRCPICGMNLVLRDP